MNQKQAFNKFHKPALTEKILLLTHTDLDAAGAVVLLKNIFPNLTIQHCSNNTMSYDIKNAVCNKEVSILYDTIFVVDISCNEEDAIKIHKNPNHKKLILLDHHQSALNLNQYPWAFVSTESLEDSYRIALYPENSTVLTSGTSLLYDFLEYFNILDKNNQHIKELVHRIACYDTWDWKNVFNEWEDCRKLNTLFDIYGCERLENKLFKYITNTDIPLFDEIDELVLDIEKDKIKNYLTTISKCYKTGNLKIEDKYYSIVFCNSNNYPAETFENMEEIHPDYDLYLINYGTGLSLRTLKKDINIGLLLKDVGGGGHAGAGGIKIDSQLLFDIIKQTLQADLFVDERT